LSEILKLENVSKYFGELKAVDNLSFSIEAGDTLGFVGPNGAGKTTTLKMITGLLRPGSGKIMLNGIDVASDPITAKKQIGYLPDEVFLYDYLTGRQYLQFICDVFAVPSKKAKDLIEHYLAFFDLSDFADEFAINYSFGMKKKLALTGTLVHEPKLLIFDEPFNGLDPKGTKELKSLLTRLSKSGTAMIITSHVLDLLEKTVNKAAIIAKGKLQFFAPVEELAKSYQDLEAAYFAFTENNT